MIYINITRTCLQVILIITFSLHTALAQSQPDTPKQEATEINKLQLKVDSLTSRLTAMQKDFANSRKIECTGTVDGLGKWVIVFFMPLVMVIFSFIFFIVFYKSKEFKVAQLIGIVGEKPTVETGHQNEPKESASNNTNKQDTKDIVSQSTSRFIALMTGLTAIFVSTTLVMYYGYMMVAQCNNAMDLDGLWKILAGLGIGIIPYGINVWNRNVKEEAATKVTNASKPN